MILNGLEMENMIETAGSVKAYQETYPHYLIAYTDQGQRYIIIREKDEDLAVSKFQRQIQQDYDWVTPYDTKD